MTFRRSIGLSPDESGKSSRHSAIDRRDKQQQQWPRGRFRHHCPPLRRSHSAASSLYRQVLLLPDDEVLTVNVTVAVRIAILTVGLRRRPESSLPDQKILAVDKTVAIEVR